MEISSDSSELNRRTLVVRGMTWNTLYQIFQMALNFGAMLILIRIVPPAEYGRWGAVVGFLALLNTLNCGLFMAQSLQLPDGVEPDWTLHWSAGLYIQIALSCSCHLLASLCWFITAYQPIAPLLHFAAFGIFLDWPNQLGRLMLWRRMDFRRLRIVHALGGIVQLFVTLGMGLAGAGAYALVLGSNVVSALPFSFDLLVIRRWRPEPHWWHWPDWSSYRPALRFGLQQAGTALLHSARGVLEAAVLPGVLGYTSIGLLNRAQALFNQTVGTLSGALTETVYPLLPRYAADAQNYPRQSTLFAQVILLVVIPGAMYIGLEGPALSRILYGEKWIAADPLIWPGAITGLGVSLFGVAHSILLAANRLRICFVLSAVAGILVGPMVILAWLSGKMTIYAWALACGQLLAGVIALVMASRLFAPGWEHVVLMPPIVSSLIAAIAAFLLEAFAADLPMGVRLASSTVLYLFAMMVVLRLIFPEPLAAMLARLPGGRRIQHWLRLPIPEAVFP